MKFHNHKLKTCEECLNLERQNTRLKNELMRVVAYLEIQTGSDYVGDGTFIRGGWLESFQIDYNGHVKAIFDDVYID